MAGVSPKLSAEPSDADSFAGLDPAPGGLPWLRLAVFLGLFALSTLIHFAVGAYGSGFGGYEDEPAHLVTALMVRDWLAGGEWGDPVGFAKSYYVHYPKVAVGQWPPVFHGILGIWMLVAGTSTAAIVTLLTLVTATIAFVVYGAVSRPLGHVAGIVAGVLFLSAPVVQHCSASAMTEMMVALLSLLAVMSFGRFMDTGRGTWVFGFAVLSIATILTKGNGLALGLVPPLAIAMGRRFDLLARPALWGAGLLVGAVCAPWYVWTVGLTQGSWAGGAAPSWAYAKLAAVEYARWLPGLAGWLGLVAVPFGLAWALRYGRLHGRWLAIAAWIPALLVLHVAVPSSVEERHLSVLAPAWAILAAMGAGVVARRLTRHRKPDRYGALGITILTLLVVFTSGPTPIKNWSGWGAAAEALVEGQGSPERMLIASDPVGEGLFVAGVALAEDERPRRVVLRGSKALCDAGWNGREYRGRFGSVGELSQWLDEFGVGLVVIDLSVRGTRHWYPHMDLLMELVNAERSTASGAWSSHGRWTLERGTVTLPGALVAFRRDGAESLPAPPLGLDDVRYEAPPERR